MIFAYERRKTTDDAGNPETWFVPIGEILEPKKGADGLERFPLLRVQDDGRHLLKPVSIRKASMSC